MTEKSKGHRDFSTIVQKFKTVNDDGFSHPLSRRFTLSLGLNNADAHTPHAKHYYKIVISYVPSAVGESRSVAFSSVRCFRAVGCCGWQVSFCGYGATLAGTERTRRRGDLPEGSLVRHMPPLCDSLRGKCASWRHLARPFFFAAAHTHRGPPCCSSVDRDALV